MAHAASIELAPFLFVKTKFPMVVRAAWDLASVMVLESVHLSFLHNVTRPFQCLTDSHFLFKFGNFGIKK